MMIKEGCSTERVQKYRQRQHEAGRKLVRFYLDAESATRLEQLASGQPNAALAETMLTTAIAQAWAAREVQQKRDREEREGCSQAHPQSAAMADSARPAHFLGRRRSFAALDDATGKVPGS